MQSLETLLRESQHRMTEPRRQVFQALEQAREPLSLPELSARVTSIDRTSVYRTLELFVRLNIVRIVHVGWK